MRPGYQSQKNVVCLTDSLTNLSLIVNRTMKHWLAMSTIIIFTISIEDISKWAIMVGKGRLNFGLVLRLG